MEYKLNEQQLEAVTSTEGYIRVIAGAGSGKTRALTHRFAFLVNELGILPGNILCVTFTNKAANEMKRRIHNLIGDSDTGYINTFHGFCVTVLQEDSHAVSYPKSFLVLDNSDIDDMLRVIYEERGFTMRTMTFSAARDMIEMQKLVRKPDYYLDLIGMSLEALHEKYLSAVSNDDIIFYGYLYHEKKCFGLDYNDLILLTLHIFNTHEDIRLKWQQRLEYIMIDEFQDIDQPQYRLMEALCGYHGNLFIVGDPDQTIYTWRGANVRFLLDFDKQFPNVRTIMMMSNYRSTPQIIAAANSLINTNRHRIRKELVPTLPGGDAVTFDFAYNQETEAAHICAKIKELLSGGADPRDIAVLYRAHYVSRAVEEALLREKIPYRVYGGVPFFGREEIKDALSYLRMAVIQDDLSFRRVVNKPKRNMGRRRMEFLEQYATEHGITLYEALRRTLDDELFKGTKAAGFVSLIDAHSAGWENRRTSDMLSALLNESGYETMLRTEGAQARLDNLAELMQSVLDFETTCGEEATPLFYLAHVALFTDNDAFDTGDQPDGGKVRLMSVHAAKGLEFPHVFLCGMNEGIFPSGKTRDLAGMEEERRLAFVAMTRAQRGLYLSGAQGRNLDGSPRYPSRFVLDIDPELIEFAQPPNEGLIADAREYIAYNEKYLPEDLSASLMTPGTRVLHEHLGAGEIIETDAAKGNYLIRFDSLPTPRRISFRVKLTAL